MTNQLNFRAKSFISEKNTSSIAYEVKRTRAVFDDALAIPGTNRRGGWRCPPGTRYGGQITDRFGRNCGWGVSRRLANEISDLGERLESVGERRQRRREQRGAARSQRGPGVVERAAGRLANALETDSSVVETPKPSRQRKGPARRRPNLRNSEQRRMDREIQEPGALRTGQSRRRRAAAEVVERPRPPAPVAKPAKKAPAKKAAAKKKAPAKKAPAKKRVTKKAPAKKAAVKKSSAPRAEAEPKLSAQRPPVDAPARPEAPNSVREKVRAAGFLGVEDRTLTADELSRFAGVNEEGFNDMTGRINLGKELLQQDMSAWEAANISELRGVVANQDEYVENAKAELQRALNRMNELEGNASDDDFQRLQAAIVAANVDYAGALNRREAFTNRLSELTGNGAPEAGRPSTPKEAAPQPIDGFRAVFNGRDRGYQRNYQTERERILGLGDNFDNLSESQVLNKIQEFQENLNYNQQYLSNLEAIDPNQRIQLPNRVVSAGDLKEEVQGVVNAWQSMKDSANARLVAINADRLPGMAGQRTLRGQELSGFQSIERARTNMNILLADYPGTRFNIIEHNGRFYAVSQGQLDIARSNGLENTRVVEFRGGLPLANELPALDSDVARQAKERVNTVIQKRQDTLAKYLDKRYGEGNAPWKEMTAERRIELSQRALQGDTGAQQELVAWAKAMYSHDEIESKNGKTYRIVATPDYSGFAISVNAVIQRKNPDGSWTRVGRSERTIFHTEDPAHVYNNSMFIEVAEDKNAGIQTIYNQHAFMYGQAAGFKYFGVSAVDDGPYVWGRVGFTEQISPDKAAKMNNEIIKFRGGESSIVKNETDARILEHLIGEYVKNPASVRHLDFIAALSIEGEGNTRKEREKELRDWFVSNMSFGSGRLNLNDNNISADPRTRART